jgi:cysteine desulfurase
MDETMNYIYLDHAASTPADPEVVEAMLPYFRDQFGNPSSGHMFGQKALDAIESARRQVAGLFHAKPQEIVFTGSGTEADNLALWGAAQALREKGRHIIISSIEHNAVLRCAEFLAASGWRVTQIPVDTTGLLDPQDVEKAISSDTVLISVMHANNELGTIQPIEEIGRIAKDRGILFHTDAVQGAGYVELDVRSLPVDMIAISGHKLYGPKGVGALFVRDGTFLTPLIHGGRHEKGRRSGTHNVPGIVGLGKACELLKDTREQNADRIGKLRDRLESELLSLLDLIRVNGDPKHRLPNILHLSIAHVDNEALLRHLDIEGVAASAGSACASGSGDISHVLKAMGRSKKEAEGGLRLSLGKHTTDEEITEAAERIEKVVKYLRSLAGY